ncbi:foldase protein PrsA [Tumebacillus sp. BK434]|uniref:peptidylprolyl isomerase n=1 Tax=Tumebacillus sp. BK434 TaxID=2512169 RepID=UPI0010DA82B0|nr:peptidylprolyl isomerase [Tumebacillus sp. BK434]TCP56059.1 foldase protein PrsA [Tumebacillus sp. BK434]
MKKAIAGAVIGAAVVGGIWFFSNAEGNVATVGNTNISEEQFYSKLEQAGGKDTLKRMIEEQVVLNQGKSLGLLATDAEIDKEIQTIIDERFEKDKAKLEAALKQSNMTLDDLKREMKISVTAKKIATKDITVSDDEIKEYYEQNKASTLGTPAKAKAKHILIKDEGKANEIYKQLQANPADFEKLAKEHSEDSSKDLGGDLGEFPKGTMVSEFEAVVFNKDVKLNEVQKPVKSEFGYHIIKVESRTDAVVPKLEDVKGKIADTLKEQKAKPFTDLITELTAKEKIKISKQEYKDIMDPAPAGDGSTDTHTEGDGHNH